MYYSKLIIVIIFLTHTSVFAIPREIFVSPSGNNSNPGTETLPLKTIQYALQAVLKNKNSDSITITLLSGTYRDGVLALKKEHSGTKTAPLTIRGKEGNTVILSDGIELKYEYSKPCNVSDIAAGIDSAYASNIRKWSFADLGITDSNYWSMASIKKKLLPQLFCNDSLMSIARWPDTGYSIIDSVIPTKPLITEYQHTKGDLLEIIIIKNAPLNKWRKSWRNLYAWLLVS